MIGNYYIWVEEDYPKGLQYLEDASEISEQVGDYLSLYFANFYLGWSFTWICEFERALECLNRCLELSVAANNLIGISYTKGVTSAVNYAYQGRIDSAYQTNKEALEITDASGDIFIKAMAHASYGITCYFKGLFSEAENNLLKGSVCAVKASQVGWEASAFGHLGHTYFDTGRYQKARDSFRKSVAALERARMLPSWRNFCKVGLVKAWVLSKDQDVNTDELSKYYETNNCNVLKGWIARDIGETLLSVDEDHISDAEAWAKKAIEADTRNGVRWSLARDYTLYAEVFKRKGDQSKAKENLTKALDIYKQCGADGWVKKYEEDSASLS